MLANHKGEIPLFILLVPLIAGIALAINLLTWLDTIWLTGLFLLLGLLFIVLNLSYKKLSLHRSRWLGGILTIVILVVAGAARVITYNELNSPAHFSKHGARSLIVKINSEPISKNEVLRFTVCVIQSADSNKKQSPADGNLLISLKDDHTDALAYGDVLLIPAKYSAINPPYNPGEFNYKSYLADQNIHYQAFLYPDQYKLLAVEKGNAIINYSLKLRIRLIEKLKLNMRDTNAIAVASTLILGYKADLSNDILQAYSKTGTVHVLSVSGAHVAILYAILALGLGFLNRFKYGKIIKAVIIVTVIWYYSLLTGFSPAVCRAAIMISLVIIGKTYNRYINTLNILAISAFMLLLYDPLYITDVGFQLSYLAVFGLVVFQPLIYKWFNFKNKWADKLWGLCSVSIAAQLITFPLSAYYFHQFPVYFLVSNLFIVIPSAVIMYTGLGYLLLPQISFASKSFAWLLEHTILVMNKILTYIEHIPAASVGKIWIDTPAYLLLYLIIISLFYFIYDQKKWLIKLALAATLLFSIDLSLARINQASSKTIAFLNLNKHYGIVFKNGEKAVIITDLDVQDKTFKYSVQPYLDSCRISDALIRTFKGSLTTPWFKKTGQFIQTLDKKIVILNHPLPNAVLSPKLTVDYIYWSGNPDINVSAINNNFICNQIIIDGTNNNSTISRLKMEAEASHTKYKILKRNNSFVTISNR